MTWFQCKPWAMLQNWMDGLGMLGSPNLSQMLYTTHQEHGDKEEERWSFDKRGVTFIQWLGPPWFLPWWSEATPEIWSAWEAHYDTKSK